MMMFYMYAVGSQRGRLHTSQATTGGTGGQRRVYGGIIPGCISIYLIHDDGQYHMQRQVRTIDEVHFHHAFTVRQRIVLV